jgi:NTE family protein
MTLTRTLLCLLLVLAAPFSGPVLADEQQRPKIGLVLSGGGARGGAHVGILQALEELNVPIDYIAGTSMGAIIGGLYASGYNAREINQILVEMDWDRALTDSPDRRDRTMRKKEIEAQFLIPYRVGFNDGNIQLPLGAIEGQHLDQILTDILTPVIDTRNFEDLPIPFRAVATDLVTGEEVVLSSGSLPDSIRASMSVPGVFAPVTIDERLLVDGGMSNNLPVSVAREMGADIVIAVDISSALLQKDQLTSVLSVTEQLTNFLTRRTTDQQIALMGEKDILIVPDLGDFSAADFEQAARIVKKGYEAAINPESGLAALSAKRVVPHDGIKNEPRQEYIVQFIDIENGTRLEDEIIRSRLEIEIGAPLDLAALNKSVDRIYSLDVFESVTYDMVLNEADQTGIVIKARPRAWGPNYIQFGLQLSSDFSGSSEFKLGAAYTRNALNDLGGELRVLATMGYEDEISFDFYQPVDQEARWYVEPELYWKQESYNIWVEDENIAKLGIGGWGAEFGVGRNFDSENRVYLGYQFSRRKGEVLTGNPELLTDPDIKIGELTLQYEHDSLDNIWFPTSGQRHLLQYLYASEELGAGSDYRQVFGNGNLAVSHGRNNWLFNYELGYSFDDAAPVERWFRLGGFGRLSGLSPDQLLGRQIALATLAYYRRLNNMDLLSAFAGFTLETGNVWNFSDEIGFDDLRYSGSVYVGAETPLGPVYAALGYDDNGEATAYFYLGNPFRARRFE